VAEKACVLRSLHARVAHLEGLRTQLSADQSIDLIDLFATRASVRLFSSHRIAPAAKQTALPLRTDY
jgi:hypothetical protein